MTEALLDEELETQLEKHQAEEIEHLQLFRLSPSCSVIITDLVRCPDETAIIRLITDDSVSKEYKRKIKSNRNGKYLELNGEKYYLRDGIEARI